MDPKLSAQSKMDTKLLVQSKLDTKLIIQPKLDAKFPVQAKPDTKLAVQSKPDTKLQVPPKMDTKSSVPSKLDTKMSVQSKLDSRVSISSKADSKSSVHSKDGKNSNKTVSRPVIWTDDETRILTDAIEPLYDKLFGVFSKKLTDEDKAKLWRDITQKVNTGKQSLRSVEEIKRKWTDLKFKVKSRSMVSLERSRNFRAFIEKAMNDHKIFTCCGVYPAIRNALKKRGWVEKPGPLAYSRSANATMPQNRGPEDESDVAWMTRVLKDYSPDFTWVIRRDNIDWKTYTKDQMINRFPKAWFTTKVGLAACLQHMHWFSEAGVADTFFPRCYRLCLEEERQAFQDDYRLTACMSYLRYFVDTFEAKGHVALADVHSKITPLSVDFASRQLGNYIRMRRHEDIDWLLPPNFMTQHWDAFIHQYYAVVHERKRLRFDTAEAVQVKYETAKKTLQKVAQYWPQIQLDGVYNMWICKPGARSRGKGIVIMNTLEKIMDLMTQNNFRECNWVVQKYIEKPMLIYKTKFDIRQWFLITDWTPLTVWFYKESYVRFCTKPFVLENFHESIHLCNNAIQCRYQNSEQRDSNLPDENMWSSDTFQAYLKTIGKLDAWPIIYSGMKQAIVGVLLASQETVESRKGCYELYGADFMLTDDFRPWLIEINSCPCMAASTSVTARMCVQCLEDTVKVVVDRKNNRNADTGMFEMIYRQNAGSVVVQQFSGHDLTVVGKKLTRDIDWPMTMSKSATNNNPRRIPPSASHIPSQSPSSTKDNLTFSELLQKLRVRNQQMFQGALATQQAHTDSIVAGMTSATPDAAGALLNKIRSLRAQDQDIITGMKKVYPTSDPKSGSKSVTTPASSFPLESDSSLMADGAKRPSTTVGKGKDTASVPPNSDKKRVAALSAKHPGSVAAITSTTESVEKVGPLHQHNETLQPLEGDSPPILHRQGSLALNDLKTLQDCEKYENLSSKTHISFDDNLLRLDKFTLDVGDILPDCTGIDLEIKDNNNPEKVVTEKSPPTVVEDAEKSEESSCSSQQDLSIISISDSSERLELPVESIRPSDKSSGLEVCGDLNDVDVSDSKNVEKGVIDNALVTEIEENPIKSEVEGEREKVESQELVGSDVNLSFGCRNVETSDIAVVKESQPKLVKQTAEVEDPNGKLYQSVLISTSESDSDSSNGLNAATHFIPASSIVPKPPVAENLRHIPKQKSHSSRLTHRRNTVPSNRRCSRRYPCYRVLLETPACHHYGKRNKAPTLPLKTINLLLPSNCSYY